MLTSTIETKINNIQTSFSRNEVSDECNEMWTKKFGVHQKPHKPLTYYFNDNVSRLGTPQSRVSNPALQVQ